MRRSTSGTTMPQALRNSGRSSLGNYEESKAWYEAALKADPSHVRTWQYYGLWQLEQGNQAQAKVHLDTIASLCGTSCPEYRSLAEAMGTVAAGGRPIY
jgi:hypothetical protein